MKKLALLTTLVLGLAARAQSSDPVSPPPLVEAPWTKLGDPVPAGYRVRSEPSWGLVGAGAATLALTYAPAAAIGIQAGQPLSAVPIIGPILAYRPSGEPWIGALFDALALVAIAVDTLAQVGGVVMLVTGLAVHKSWIERVPPPLQVVPVAPGSDLGASVVGRF